VQPEPAADVFEPLESRTCWSTAGGYLLCPSVFPGKNTVRQGALLSCKAARMELMHADITLVVLEKAWLYPPLMQFNYISLALANNCYLHVACSS